MLNPKMVTELISGEDGELKVADLNDFINSVKIQERGISYSVVSIIGPHKTGKSSLLNILFGTSFKQRDMNTKWGVPVTRGVWIAKAAGEEPFTLVMDVEGTDSKLKGQDTAFEKQSALFALAVADILLINTLAAEFGREDGAIRPLLRTIFQEALMMPEIHPRKTTLFLVARDLSPDDPPLKKSDQMDDIEKIWEEAPKPGRHAATPLHDFFNVECFALTDGRERKGLFEEQVEEIRKKYRQRVNSVSDEDRQRWVLPASGFCLSIEEIWEAIKNNKSFNLPALMIMVATTMCDQIAEEKLGLFKSNQVWQRLQEAAEISFDAGFGANISPVLNESLSAYDSETRGFDENVRNSKRECLKSGVLTMIHPAYIKNLGHLHSEEFQNFKTLLQAPYLRLFAESARPCKDFCVAEFVRRCSEAGIEEAGWDDDDSTVRQQLDRDIENHTRVAAAEELSKVINECRDQLSRDLNISMAHLCWSEEISWAAIRSFVREKSSSAESNLRSGLESFELEQVKVEEKVDEIRQYARQLVENYFRQQTTNEVLQLMTRRYLYSFAQQMQTQTQTQTAGNEDIMFHQAACRQSLKILSVMAAIRLDEGEGEGEGDDDIESVLVSAVIPAGGGEGEGDALHAREWPQLPPQAIALISPTECKDIWTDFIHQLGAVIPTAHSIQEAMSREGGFSRVPPTWVIVGLSVLGITGFLLFLRLSNLDVVLVVLEAAGQGISFLATREGMGLLAAGASIAFSRHTGMDFDRFRRTHGDLMRNLGSSLLRLHSYLVNRSSTSTSIQVAA